MTLVGMRALQNVTAVFCSACIAALPFAAAAQSSASITLEPVIITSSRIPTPLGRTAQSATVIPRDRIEAMQPSSAIEILRRVPGLHIDQPGGRGSVSSVYLRGGDPNYTLVLIDGVPVNDPTNSRGGSFDFSTLNAESIERIEVVRGPQSAVYGSNAMSGVINIITREPADRREMTFDAGVGTEGHFRGDALMRGPAGPVRYALGAGYLDNGEPVRGSGFNTRHVTGKLDLAATDSGFLKVHARFARSEAASFPDDSGGPRFAVLRGSDKRDIDEFTIGGQFDQKINGWWDVTLNASQYLREEDALSPGVAPGLRDPFGIPRNTSDSEFRRSNASLSNLFTLSNRVKVTAGAGVEREEGESRSILFLGPVALPGRFSLDRATYAAFGEAEVALPGGLILQPGLRVDFPEDFRTQYSPRVGALYRIDGTGTTLKAAWGRGFKLPAFYSLANPIVGNPDLKPEKSESWDAGISQDFWDDRATASLTLFHSRFEDIIDFEAGPPPRLVNRSEATAKGAEFGLTLRPSGSVTANGHLTYTKTDIKDSRERLRSRPTWRGGVDADWRPRPDLRFYAGLLYVGKVFDSSIPTGDRWLDDYVRVDIAATWSPMSNLALTLAVDNLLDAKYDEAVGFRAAGIRPRLSARVSF